MARLAGRTLGLLGVMLVMTTWANADLLSNGGFEEIDDQGQPVGWIPVDSLGTATTTDEQPHSGQRAARIIGDGVPHSWRQIVEGPATRLYRLSGWFRAKDVKLEAQDKEQFARFYVHILYRDRPYSDASQIYADLPVGTYDWKRIALRLVPQVPWPIDRIWITVVGKFSAGTIDCDDIEMAPAQGGGGASVLEWANGARPAVLSDMSQCTPASALGKTARVAQWKLIDYEAGGISGTMVWSPEEGKAPELTLPLQVTGWHAIYVCVADPAWLGCQAQLRLSNDPAPVPRARGGGQFEEAFYKVADLTGQSLHISRHPQGPGCGVAYVKLVPLTPEEVAALKARRADEARRRLVTTIDGFSFIYERRCTTRADLLREVEVYRNSDFGTLLLQPGGADMVNYPSTVGEMIGKNLELFDRTGDRYYAEALRELARQKINPTKVLIEGAHDVGMKVHIALRPGAWEHTEPLNEFFTSRFYREHPEWHCLDRDGTQVMRMSYAVPQVRAHLIEVLREAVGFGADGACVLYVRGVPFVLFEKPFADLFRQRFGVEAKDVAETDQRLLDLRAEIMTTFMREIRAMLDEEGRQRGTKLQLSAMMLADEKDNRRFGLDLRQWVKEGLIDLVMPYLHGGGGAASTYDMAFFREACGPTGLPVKPTFLGWDTPSLAAMITQGAALYEQGADGLTFWDGNSGDDRTDRWAVLSRMGSVTDVQEMVADGPPQPVTVRVHRLGQAIMDGPYYPNWGY